MRDTNTVYAALWKNTFKQVQGTDAQAMRVSLFDMELGEMMVVQDREELLPTKLKHIFVPFELKHAAPQGLRVYHS